MNKVTIGFIGAGNMGRSLIEGLLQSPSAPQEIFVCDHHPDRLQDLIATQSITLLNAPKEVAHQSDVVVLAVKPQSMKEVLQQIQGFEVSSQPLLMSIAAGITIAQIVQFLHVSESYPIVRVMPNTPAIIKQGVSGLFAQKNLPLSYRSLAESIMLAVGKTVWLSDEALMDVVTALSGSGPAYFFYFIEKLIKGAIELGLVDSTARELTLQTGIGALQMALHSEKSLSELRQQVTSKGGTTEAGIAILDQNNLETILEKALSAATRRAKELSQKLFN
ncbi:MAG TPA: pyrroline-5-carboxylate reductase [Gammaproteobacteria bacterium]|nr:pyrroline-5-carboxylate reductase [Gammaproteobacteria bacterium]